VDGASPRGQASIERLEGEHPRLRLIHLPIHASWLNQVEIYLSILERKVLTPADARSLDELAARILAFQSHYELLANPFEWKFTRADLARLLGRLAVRGAGPVQQAA